MKPRDLIKFRHIDASQTPKRRPAVVANGPQGGRFALFYSSTFKRRGHPPNAIEVDPLAEPGSPAGALANKLRPAIDERCFFHGSMLSETHTGDSTVETFPGTSFPRDSFLTLEAQAEELLLAFHTAWERLTWLRPNQRAFALDQLWWQPSEPQVELALTLVLYDGLSVDELSKLTWSSRGLLPRSQSMLARHRESLPERRDEDRVFDSAAQILGLVQRGWQALYARGQRQKPRVHLPRQLPPTVVPD